MFMGEFMKYLLQILLLVSSLDIFATQLTENELLGIPLFDEGNVFFDLGLMPLSAICITHAGT